MSFINTQNNKLHFTKHILAILFCVIFASISLVNHFNYRTYALDLGLFNHSIWNYAHLQNANYSILDELFNCQLGDHFSLYFILISPLYYVFGTYTLLLFQIAAIIFAGYGVYQYAENKNFSNKYIPLILMTHFYGIWGIYSALGFDYHDNTVAAMFVPWFLYFFELKNIKKIILFFILIIIGKENMALWLGFICIGLMFLNLNQKKFVILSLVLAIISFVYFFIVMKYVLPAINAGHGYFHIKYSVFGISPLETLIHKPLDILYALFNNHSGNSYYDGIKRETYFMFLISGGFLLIIKPQYILMLVPIFAQKMLSDDPGKWGINFHYSIEFAPIISIGIIDALSIFKLRSVFILIFSSALLCLNYSNLFLKFEKRKSEYFSKTNNVFYDPTHYKCFYNRDAIQQAIKLIPDTAKIAATSMLLPHIPNHKYIYQYPFNKNANCFFLLEKPEAFYMYTKEELDKFILYLRTDSNWKTLYDKHGVCLFVKNRFTK